MNDVNIVLIAGTSAVSPSVAGSVRSQLDAHAHVSVLSPAQPRRQLFDVDDLVVVGDRRNSATASGAARGASVARRGAAKARRLARRARSRATRPRGRGAVGRRLARAIGRCGAAQELLDRADVIVALDKDAVGAAWVAARRRPGAVAALGVPAAAQAVAVARGDA